MIVCTSNDSNTMDITHELFVGENQSIIFKKGVHPETGLPTGEWTTIISIKGLEIEYSFYETVFKKWILNEIGIRWEVVKHIIDNVLGQMDILLQKSSTLLVALHKEIFGNEYKEKQGYFEFSSIEIVEVRDYFYEFDLRFWLESHSNFLMDPYFSYFVRFKNETQTMLTPVGVRRE